MFAIEHEGYTVFFLTDPRLAGFDGCVFEGVNLTSDEASVHNWPPGTARPSTVLAKSGTEFRIFANDHHAVNAGFVRCLPLAGPFKSWSEYQRKILRQSPAETKPQ